VRRTFAALFFLLALWASQALAASSYQVTSGANTDITEYTTCKTVTNNHPSAKTIFVPTNSSPEWAAFYNSPGSIARKITTATVLATNTIRTIQAKTSRTDIYLSARLPAPSIGKTDGGIQRPSRISALGQ
jgi:hypothetical protein